MCELRPPFLANNYLELAMKIKEAKISKIHFMYSNDLFKTIQQMLQPDPKRRPSVEDLMAISHVNI